MSTISQQLDFILNQIRHAECSYQRAPQSVSLLAVSKSKPASAIAQAYFAGQRHFGENYLQEALQKQKQLSAFNITWHFIGAIQSNKTKLLAENFAWVHSVDNVKVAQRLSQQRPKHLPPLNICLQVNICDEHSKSGIALNELPLLVEQILVLPNIKLRGVMAIPAPANNFKQQCEPYRVLYSAVKELNNNQLNTFSFGMSGDLDAAISQGATIVRIGTALFGARD